MPLQLVGITSQAQELWVLQLPWKQISVQSRPGERRADIHQQVATHLDLQEVHTKSCIEGQLFLVLASA